MGCGEKNLFSKRFFPHKTVLQQPLRKIFFKLLSNHLKMITALPSASRWSLYLP